MAAAGGGQTLLSLALRLAGESMDDVDIQMAFVRTLSLCDGDKVQPLVVFKTLAAGMMEHRTNLELQYHACTELARATVRCEENRRLAVDGGALVAVVSTLATHRAASVPRHVELFLRTLLNLLLDSETSCAHACAVSAIDTVVDVLCAQRGDVGIQERGFEVLYELTHAAADWTPSDTDSVIAAAVAGLRVHVAVASVQASGLLLLCGLQPRRDAEVARHMGDNGVIEVVVAALHAHSDTSLQSICCRLLCHLVIDPTHATRAGDARGAEAVVDALRRQLSNESVLSFACMALQRMIRRNRDNCLAAVGAGILDTLTEALRLHPTAASAQLTCVSLLADVADDCGSHVTLPLRLKVCDAVLDTLHVHGADSQVAQDGLRFLRNMLPLDAEDAGGTAVIYARMVETATRLMHGHSARIDVAYAGCGLLYSLSVWSPRVLRADVRGVIGACILMLQVHVPEEFLCHLCCSVLCNVQEDSIHAFNAGIYSAVVGALRAHPSDIRVQRDGLRVLCIFQDHISAEHVRDGDLVGLVQQALREHALVQDAVISGCGLLRHAMRVCPHGDACTGGVVHAVVGVMDAWPATLMLQEFCCSILTTALEGSSAMLLREDAASLSEAVIRALETFDKCATLQIDGMKIITTAPFFRDAAPGIRMSAVRAITKALRASALRSMHLYVQCCMALHSVVDDSPDNQVLAGEAGAVEALVDLLCAAPTAGPSRAVDLLREGFDVLFQLLHDNVPNQLRAVREQSLRGTRLPLVKQLPNSSRVLRLLEHAASAAAVEAAAALLAEEEVEAATEAAKTAAAAKRSKPKKKRVGGGARGGAADAITAADPAAADDTDAEADALPLAADADDVADAAGACAEVASLQTQPFAAHDAAAFIPPEEPPQDRTEELDGSEWHVCETAERRRRRAAAAAHTPPADAESGPAAPPPPVAPAAVAAVVDDPLPSRSKHTKRGGASARARKEREAAAQHAASSEAVGPPQLSPPVMEAQPWFAAPAAAPAAQPAQPQNIFDTLLAPPVLEQSVFSALPPPPLFAAPQQSFFASPPPLFAPLPPPASLPPASAPARRVPPPYRPPNLSGAAPSLLPAVGDALASQLAHVSLGAPPPDASSSSTGLANASGEYNCFLNSLVQALFHVRRFRTHLLNSHVPAFDASPAVMRSIALVSSLKQLFESLHAGASLRREAAPALSAWEAHMLGMSGDSATAASSEAVAPTALRHALAAVSTSGEGEMYAMADAAEVLGTMYEAFQAVSSFYNASLPAAESPISRLFAIGVHEGVQCAACRVTSHVLRYSTFFHIVSRCVRCGLCVAVCVCMPIASLGAPACGAS
jgi:hypothetical protein